MDLSWQHPSFEVQHGEGETALVLALVSDISSVVARHGLARRRQLRRAFVSVNKSWASSVRFDPFSSTCRLDETESLADSRLTMSVARILIAPCSHAMRPCRKPCLYAFSSTRWVAYSEVLRSVMENPNA
jgi:hypothetical protein